MSEERESLVKLAIREGATAGDMSAMEAARYSGLSIRRWLEAEKDPHARIERDAGPGPHLWEGDQA